MRADDDRSCSKDWLYNDHRSLHGERYSGYDQPAEYESPQHDNQDHALGSRRLGLEIGHWGGGSFGGKPVWEKRVWGKKADLKIVYLPNSFGRGLDFFRVGAFMGSGPNNKG